MGKLNVQTTKLQDVKIITPAVFGDHRGFLKKPTLIVILKKLALILTLFRIINHCLRRLVFCVAYTSSVVRPLKLS